MVVWSPSFSSLVAVAAAAGVVAGDGTGETDVGVGVAAIVGEDVGDETIAGFVVVAVDGPMAAFVFDGAAKVAGGFVSSIARPEVTGIASVVIAGVITAFVIGTSAEFWQALTKIRIISRQIAG